MDLNKIMTDMKSKLNLHTMHTIKNDFNGMCLPSKIYLVVSALSIIFSMVGMLGLLFTSKLFGKQFISVLFRYILAILVIIFWTFTLQLFCDNGYEWLSWGIIILRYSFIFIVTLMFLSNAKLNKKALKRVEKMNREEKKQIKMMLKELSKKNKKKKRKN